MKYPKEQFEVLKDCIKQFAPIYNVKASNLYTLHYMCYQQLAKEGQEHNHLYVYGSEMKRFGNLNNDQKNNFVKLINIDYDFKLYPDGCNDDHILTAMKSAMKDLHLTN
jgi:hypothetical protein